MIRRVLLVILVLCLVVPAVNAVSVDLFGGEYQTASIGSADSVTINIIDDVGSRIYLGCNAYAGTSNNPYFNADVTNANSVTIPLQSGYNSVKVVFTGRNPQVGIHATITISYTYQEPTPEPDNTPRLEATQTASTPIYISYVIQTKPDTGYTFTEITTTPQEPTTILGIEFINPLQSWKPKQNKAFNVPRGSSTTFYTLAKNWQDVQIVTLTLSAPALFNTTNQSSPQIDPANPLYNPPPVPTVTPGNPNQNPLTSGQFRPGTGAIITPFTQFTENLHTYGRLQKIASPAELRESALNGTSNITAGLYDIIDRITGVIVFPATTTATALNTVLNPIESMIIYCDTVLQQIIASVDNFLLSIYPLRDFFYLCIPDFVWWIMAAIIMLEMFLTVMSFLYGRSITLMHLFGFYKDSK